MHHSDGFLRAIYEAPDDNAPRLIYADFLEESGDPICAARAELIRIECALAAGKVGDLAPRELREHADAILAAHRKTWNGATHRRLNAGPLRGQVRARRGIIKSWQYRRGFIAEMAAHVSVPFTYSAELPLIGPLERLRLWGARNQLEWVLTSPVVARLKELDLTGNELTDAEARLLARSSHLSHLEMLDLRRNLFTPWGLNLLEQAILADHLPESTWLYY